MRLATTQRFIGIDAFGVVVHVELGLQWKGRVS